MYFVIYASGAVLLAWSIMSLLLVPDSITLLADSRADVVATNFITYHQAVANYVAVNKPVGASVVVADGVLLFPDGYVRSPDWGNQVVDGYLYTYSLPTFVMPPGFMEVVQTLGRKVCVRDVTAGPTGSVLCGDSLNRASPGVGNAVNANVIRAVPGSVASATSAGAVVVLNN